MIEELTQKIDNHQARKMKINVADRPKLIFKFSNHQIN